MAARRILNEISTILQHDIMPSAHCHNVIAIVAISRRPIRRGSEIRLHVARRFKAVTAEVRPVVFRFVLFFLFFLLQILSLSTLLTCDLLLFLFITFFFCSGLTLSSFSPSLMFPPTHLLPSQQKSNICRYAFCLSLCKYVFKISLMFFFSPPPPPLGLWACN